MAQISVLEIDMAKMTYLWQEPGMEVLQEMIQRPTTFLAMHACDLGEGYDDFFRADGLTAAQTAWTNTLAPPFTLHRDTDDVFIRQVGVIQGEKWGSFADAFVLACAERLNVPLVTTNPHEFATMERKGHCRVS